MSDRRPRTSTNGGPVVIIPKGYVHLWRGTDPPIGATVPDGWQWGQSGGPICDYDRACDPQDPINLSMSVLGHVPITGSSSNSSALIYGGEDGVEYRALNGIGTMGLLIEGAYDENRERIDDELNELEENEWIRMKKQNGENFIFHVDGPTDGNGKVQVFMFDSAYPGSTTPPEGTLENGFSSDLGDFFLLAPGSYAVDYVSDLADSCSALRLSKIY